MSTKEILLEELQNAPDVLVTEALDFVRFLKSGRFAALLARPAAPTEEAIDMIFDKPRALRDLANEQQAFLASLPVALVDIDLPCEE